MHSPGKKSKSTSPVRKLKSSPKNDRTVTNEEAPVANQDTIFTPDGAAGIPKPKETLILYDSPFKKMKRSSSNYGD